ncbi:MAG: hypothetical protein ACYS8W_00405 [Planctomycetota bacterium]
MNRLNLPVATLAICILLCGNAFAGEQVVIITKDKNIYYGEIISETDTHLEIKERGESGTRKIAKSEISKRMTPEEFEKNRIKILRELMGIEVDEPELPEPVEVGKSHEIDKLKFTWVSAVISPIELEAPDDGSGFGGMSIPPTDASYLVINYEVENGTSKNLNIKGIYQRMACVGFAKTDKDKKLEQIIFMWPYKGVPDPDPRLGKGGKLNDSIFFQAPPKEVKTVTVTLDTDRIMHRGGGNLLLTVPLKDGAIDNAGTFDMKFEVKPKKKRSEIMEAEVMKDVFFEIFNIETRIVTEEKLGNKGPSIDLAGEKMVINFTVHNRSKSKVQYTPILARQDSYSQVARDDKGETVHEYNPPESYVCGRLRPTRDQMQVTLEPGEMVADIVVLDPPSESAKFVRYLLDVNSLFSGSKLDAMFNVKIFLRDGCVYGRKKPKFKLDKRRVPLTEKQATALAKDFVKKGKDKFTEKNFGYRVIGKAKVTRIENRELESGNILTIVFCEVGKEFQRGNKTSFMVALLKIGPTPYGISQGDMITYKGSIIGGETFDGEEGPEHAVLIALKEAKKG